MNMESATMRVYHDILVVWYLPECVKWDALEKYLSIHCRMLVILYFILFKRRNPILNKKCYAWGVFVKQVSHLLTCLQDTRFLS